MKPAQSKATLILPVLLLAVLALAACVPSTPLHPTATMQNTPTPPVDLVPLAPFPDPIIMYEVNLRAFSPSGGLSGVTARLDDLKALGVNTIYLMPIYPIGKIKSVNSPYSVSDYTQVNPEFGTLADLQALTNAAHERDMAVILDWVANHSAWDNPWIENEGWYSEKNGKIIQPEGTGWADVADLNYDNPEMRAAMIDALTFWVLQANVDGFRFDAADLVPFDFWEQALSALNAIPNRKLILLAEGARGDHFAAGFQMNYGWNFYNQLKRVYQGEPATSLYSTHLADYANLQAGQNLLHFTTNHDESAWDASPITLFNGKQGALAASVITFYMGGVPMLYTGQETGREATTPFFSRTMIDWNANPDMRQIYQDMLTFYSQSSALRSGDLRDCSSQDVVCFTRSSGTQTVLVIANVRNELVNFTLPADIPQMGWVDAFKRNPVALDRSTALEPYTWLVLGR